MDSLKGEKKTLNTWTCPGLGNGHGNSISIQKCHVWSLCPSNSWRKDRNVECVGMEGILQITKFQPPAMGRDTSSPIGIEVSKFPEVEVLDRGCNPCTVQYLL